MKPVIEVSGISKSYIINHKDRASYNTIKDDFSNLLSSPLGKKEDKTEKFWALKDISFNIMPGEIFGIIGRNGSGKSTLLKILSRVVEPTNGHIKIKGKVASLLEVGTGFHPELTGRENIFFNGSMLGMSRKEIQSKFDEIVAFSEIEKFIDTPVKFYSSGMYVRLAFSVAAHLDPDVLILDEVLAVGDSSFQQKSMKKIKSTMEGGTTVIFVSHSMGAIQQLCNRGVLLNKGVAEFVGPINDVIEKYTGEPPKPTGKLGFYDGREGKHDIMIQDVSIRDKKDNVTPNSNFDEPLRLYIETNLDINLGELKLDFNILNESKEWVSHFTSVVKTSSKKTNKFIFQIEKLNLSPGIYSANISIFKNRILEDFIPNAITFSVNSTTKITKGVNGVTYNEGVIIEYVK